MVSSRTVFVGCCILAATLVVISAVQQGMPDPDHYRVYAEEYATVFSGRPQWPDAHRSPFYPLVLSPIVNFVEKPVPSIIALHVALTIATLMAVWILARRVSEGVFLPFVATMLVAVDPILVFQSGQIMTETLFTTLLVWSLLPWINQEAVSRQSAVASGLLAGLAFLTRPAMAPIFAAVGLSQLIVGSRVDLRRWVLATGVAVLVAVPWAVVNYSRWKELVFTTTHGGYTLWLANNQSFYETEVVGGRNWAGSPEFDRWSDRNAELEAERFEQVIRGWTPGLRTYETRFVADALYHDLATGWIRTNPEAASRAALYRLSMFWGLQPRTGSKAIRPFIGVYFAAIFLLSAIGWFLSKSWRGPWLTATFAILALSIVHTIYWSNMRFRAPIEPLLAVWAAVSIEKLWRSLKPAT